MRDEAARGAERARVEAEALRREVERGRVSAANGGRVEGPAVKERPMQDVSVSDADVEALRRELDTWRSRAAQAERRLGEVEAGAAPRVAELERRNRQLAWQVSMLQGEVDGTRGRRVARLPHTCRQSTLSLIVTILSLLCAVRPAGNQHSASDAAPAEASRDADGLPKYTTATSQRRGPPGPGGAPSAFRGHRAQSVLDWVLAHRTMLMAGYVGCLHLAVYLLLTHRAHCPTLGDGQLGAAKGGGPVSGA